MNIEFELFQGTNFSDLMRDIYHNSKKKARQIDGLIKELQPLIKNTGDASVLVPMIKDYLEVSVKNDDALVKLASVVQRLISVTSKESSDSEFGLTDEERRQLLDEAETEVKKIQAESKVIDGKQHQSTDGSSDTGTPADPIRPI
jgi:hypothetical protein